MSQEQPTARTDSAEGAEGTEATETSSADAAQLTDTAQPAAAPRADQHEEQDTTQRGEQARSKQNKSKTTNARKTRSVTLTLTVTGTADGEWQAELKHGSTWMARGVSVPAAAVSRAAKELHDELSTPIDEVIEAAREQQQARVAQLEAELEQAKQALASMDEE